MKSHKTYKFQPIGFLIREIRLKQRRKARDVAKQVGIDPRALNAIEKGRIRNPSIDRLAEISNALGMNVTQLLMLYEGKKPGRFMEGSSIGEFTMNCGKKGFRLVSYTPPIREMFCGKMMLGGKKQIDPTKFSISVTIFIQMLIGRLIVTYQDREITLKEGKTLLLNGAYDFSFYNPTQRETSFLFFTSPAPWGQAFLEREL